MTPNELATREIIFKKYILVYKSFAYIYIYIYICKTDIKGGVTVSVGML